MHQRLLVAIAALLALCGAAPAMAQPPTMGSRVDAVSSGGVSTLGLTGVTTGSGVAVIYLQTGADADQTADLAVTVGTASFSPWATGYVRNSSGGTNTQACHIWVAHNVQPAAGALTITLTNANGTAIHRGMASEALAMATSNAIDVEDGVGETVTTAESHSMAAPGLNTLTNVLLFGGAAASGTNAAYAAASGFTPLLEFDTTAATAQYRESADARVGETATWTNPGTGRGAANCLIALKSSTSAAGAAAGPHVGSHALTGHGK